MNNEFIPGLVHKQMAGEGGTARARANLEKIKKFSERARNIIHLAKAENTGSATVLVLAVENKQRCLMALLALCRGIRSSVCRGLSLHRYLIGDRHAN